MSDQMKLISIRLSDEDLARLDKLAAAFPLLGRTTVAREAMRRGLALLEEIAAKTTDEMERVAALGARPKAKTKGAR